MKNILLGRFVSYSIKKMTLGFLSCLILGMPIFFSVKVKAETNYFVDLNNPAKRQADEWRNSRPDDAKKVDLIANQPFAKWLVGGSTSDVYNEVNNYTSKSSSAGKVGILVAYNIPGRDCNSYSAGGASSQEFYKEWISSFSNALQNRSTIIILEPDALAGMDCLDSNAQKVRMDLINFAVQSLKRNSNVKVYIDAGNSNWVDVMNMAQRLSSSGVHVSDGFSLNVSNFYLNSDLIVYGTRLSNLIGGKHFVIDTSRNGNGPTKDFQWCNPWGRSIGSFPTSNTGNSLVDAFLWIKVPGESDGSCFGALSAGQWWGDYALDLVKNTRNDILNNVTNLSNLNDLVKSVLSSSKQEFKANNDSWVENWWPVDGTNVSGNQPFKAILKGKDENGYKMYWKVDNGQLNYMYQSYDQAPHKEAWVNLDWWNWKQDGNYSITFVAKDFNGNVLTTKTISIKK